MSKLTPTMLAHLERHGREANLWAANENTSKALVKRGLLAVTGGTMWPRYTITDAGRKALADVSGGSE